MSDGLHLSPDHRGVLEALLREHLPDIEVWAYGSWAYGSWVNGRGHGGSHLDLGLWAPAPKSIPADRLGDFADAVCESTIPFLGQARDWSPLPAWFRREIQRKHAT